VPQIAFVDFAQKVLAHWASSPHAVPLATVPAPMAHADPRSPPRNVAQVRAGIDCAQADVRAGVALVPGAPKVGAQFKIQRALHVAWLPKATLMTNVEHSWSLAQ
jgi:hypothetical protein